MTSPRQFSLARCRRLALLSSAVALLAARGAAGQCTVSVPYKFEPPAPGTYPVKFTVGWTKYADLYTAASVRRMILRQNFGYSILSLADPVHPAVLSFLDIEGAATFGVLGDGDHTVGDVAAAPDGTRALVNYNQSNHGTLLQNLSGSPFAGEFTTGTARVAILKSGTRYVGFALRTVGLVAADVTAFVSGSGSIMNGSIMQSSVPGAGPGATAPIVAGNFVVYATGPNVVVVDASTLGPPGPMLAANFHTHTFGPATFGLTAGQPIYNVAAAIHPVDGKLYVMAETTSAGSTTGLGIASSTDGVTFTPVAPVFVPSAPWSGPGSMFMGVSTLIATSTDLMALFWERNGSNKLFTLTVSGWGTDFTPAAVFDPVLYSGDFPRPWETKGFASGALLYTYTLTEFAGFEMTLDCANAVPPVLVTVAPNGPATVPAFCPVSLSATATGGTGSYATYAWTFGDGFTGSGQTVSHAYASPGPYSPACTVTDSGSHMGSGQTPVTVTPETTPPTVTAPAPAAVAQTVCS